MKTKKIRKKHPVYTQKEQMNQAIIRLSLDQSQHTSELIERGFIS